MGNGIKKPISKGVCKVPVVMQLEALECGAASLCMILAYYNKWIPIEQVRSDCGVSRDGSNAKNMMLAARNYGLEAKGYRFEPERLKEVGKFPCIIHWNFNHFVVLRGFRNNKAYLNDPAKGDYSISMKEFDESFTGITIMFEPTEAFVPSGKQKSVLSFAKKRLRGAGIAVLFVALTSLIASLLEVINPAFSRIFLDRLLTWKNPEWIGPFFAAYATFAVVQLLVMWVNVIYSLKIDGKMAVIGSTTYMWKVLNLPIEFFSQRMSGDIKARKESNSMIANTLVNTFAPLILDSFMMIFYLVIMTRYSIVLTVVGISSIAINVFVSQYISKKRINISRVLMRDSAKLTSTTVSGIEMVETIKASGAENGFFEKWAGYQAGTISGQTKTIKINAYLGMIPTFVSEIANMIVLFLGVYFAMTGDFTIGKIMAFQGFLAAFMAPATSLVTAGQDIMEMRTEMERIEDVMEYPSDDILSEKRDDKDEEYNKLTGDIEIKNLVFGYSPLAEPLIKDLSLTIKKGQRIAIVGGSGCGKSTISKLITGLYKPWSGEILFDGKPLSAIDKNVFHGSVAVVDQDIILFEDTIANNIKMWDDSIEDFEMILAARDAQIHSDIVQREGGYQCKLIEGGRNFSGGQKQRLEIARVLAQDPTIIILDEATSALDAKTEYEVVKAINERGITCVVVAHRLSTIRDCDEIIVMNQGEIVGRGTHEQLMADNELYRSLVINE